MGWEWSLILCLSKPFNLIETIKPLKLIGDSSFLHHTQLIPFPSFYFFSFWRDDTTLLYLYY